MSSVIKIGELRTVLPPLGTNSIMAQNHAIPATGVPLIITKELLVLYQASIIRIVGDPIDPQIFRPLTAATASNTTIVTTTCS